MFEPARPEDVDNARAGVVAVVVVIVGVGVRLVVWPAAVAGSITRPASTSTRTRKTEPTSTRWWRDIRRCSVFTDSPHAMQVGPIRAGIAGRRIRAKLGYTMATSITIRLHPMPLANQRSAWRALQVHHAQVRELHLRQLFADDPGRGERLATEAVGLYFDYSKHRVTPETLDLLLRLANESGLRERIDAMFRGERINVTENRAVLHVALRTPADEPRPAGRRARQRGCSRKTLRGGVHQRVGGAQVRHRPAQHVRVLGLGRRPLFDGLGDRPVDDDRHRPRTLPRDAGRLPRHG